MKYCIEQQLDLRTMELINRFSIALQRKLFEAQVKYGYEADWMNNDWEAECRKELMRHIEKGDPVDVAAFCAFMWHHAWSTSPTPSKISTPELKAEVEAEAELLFTMRCSGL